SRLLGPHVHAGALPASVAGDLVPGLLCVRPGQGCYMIEGVLAEVGAAVVGGGGLLLGFLACARLRLQRDHALRHLHVADLTGPPNRRALMTELDRRAISGEAYTLAFVDMDGFKSINDTYGHGVADQVLADVAYRLRQQVNRATFLARLHGDEFVIVF